MEEINSYFRYAASNFAQFFRCIFDTRGIVFRTFSKEICCTEQNVGLPSCCFHQTFRLRKQGSRGGKGKRMFQRVLCLLTSVHSTRASSWVANVIAIAWYAAMRNPHDNQNNYLLSYGSTWSIHNGFRIKHV